MEGIPGCFGFGVPQPYDLTHYSPALGGYWDFPESPEPQVVSPSPPKPSLGRSLRGPQKQCCSPPTPLSLPLCLCVSLSMSLSLLTQPSESANFKPGFSLK